MPEICPKKNKNRLKLNKIKRSVGGAYCNILLTCVKWVLTQAKMSVTLSLSNVTQHKPKEGGRRMINNAKLKGLMAERGLTVVALAQMLGVSRQSASEKVNGKVRITLTEAQTIAKALNMSKEERDTIFFTDFVKSEATL